jgi:hypothetical protein
MTGFEDYVSEQFPGRDLWVEGKTSADVLLGRTDNGRIFFGKANRLYLKESIDWGQLERNLTYINEFFSQILDGYTDAECYILAAPTSRSIEKDNMPANAPVENELDVIKRLRDSIEKRVKICDPTDALIKAYEGGTEVYYRTDHHWTADGAFVAYKEWADTAGIEAAAEEEFEIRTLCDDFLGMADSKGRLPWTKSDSIKVYYRKSGPLPHVIGENISSGNTELEGLYDYSYLSLKNKYNVFMGGNYSVARVDTGVRNGRTLLIVRDSFANCFVPLLTSHFEKIILVDLRYYSGRLEDFFEEEEANSVLLLYSAMELANNRNMYGLK